MYYQNQTGAVLITGLMILLIATIIGVSAVQNTAFDERMANNARSQQLAFQAAEAALKVSEKVTKTTRKENHFAIKDHLTDEQPTPYDDASWNGATEVEGFENLATSPRYVIQEVPNSKQGSALNNNNTSLYRITARAEGSINTSVIVLEQTVRY